MKLSASVTVLAALGALAGCATEDRVTPAPAPGPLVVGNGRVDSIVPVTSAAAGASVANGTKRVGVRMDNGMVQYLDTTAVGLSVGDRVQITSDGKMVRPAP